MNYTWKMSPHKLGPFFLELFGPGLINTAVMGPSAYTPFFAAVVAKTGKTLRCGVFISYYFVNCIVKKSC